MSEEEERESLGFNQMLRLAAEAFVFESARVFLRNRSAAGRLFWATSPPRVRKLRPVQDYHQGEDCFLIGNGPSLNQTDLFALKGRHCIGLNKIFLMFERQPIDLSYLVSINPLVIKQALDEFQKLELPVFLASQFVSGRTKPNVVPIRSNKQFGFGRTIYSNFAQSHTVTFVALQIAFAMGFRRVFLIGVDHSFQQKGKANETQTMEGNDPNHFDPNYFKGQDWQLADLEGSELGYRIADFVYERDGRKIYDATVGGALDIFEKIEFDKAVEECRIRDRKPLRF